MERNQTLCRYCQVKSGQTVCATEMMGCVIDPW